MGINYIKKEDVLKATRGAGISGSTRSSLVEQFGNSNKIKKGDFEKILRNKGRVGSYIEKRMGSITKTKNTDSSVGPNKRGVSNGKQLSKPKTSWWQALKGGNPKLQGGGSINKDSFSNLRSKPGSSSFVSSAGSSSKKPSFTSSGKSTATSRPRNISLK